MASIDYGTGPIPGAHFSGRTQPLSALFLGLGAAVNVALQVGQFQLADGEPLAEGGGDVPEMQLDPLDGPGFERTPVRHR